MPTKSLLVNFSSYPSSIEYLTPDNGLAMLAGTLLEAGHETLIIDYCTLTTMRRFMPPHLAKETGPAYDAYVEARTAGGNVDQLRTKLLNLDAALREHRAKEIEALAVDLGNLVEVERPDFVGFKLWTGDGYLATVRMAQYLKSRFPRLPIVGGGPHVDLFGVDILEHAPAIDMVVQGEGEPSIVPLAEALATGTGFENVPNLLYRGNGGIHVNPVERPEDLDALAHPIYDPAVYPALAGDEKLLLLMVDESRGCPNRCAFCVHPAKSGGFWRVRSAKRVVDGMQEMNRQLGTRAFRLAGSNTPGKLKNEIAEELLARHCGFKYAAFDHVRDADVDFDLLKRSGCAALFYGIESGDPRILRNLNKRITPDHVRETIPRVTAAGIAAVTSYIAGTPGETQESLGNSADLIAETRPQAVQITPPYVIPGSLWWEHPERYNIEFAENARQRIMTLSLPWMLPLELWEEVPPYSIDGKSFTELAMESAWLTARAEEAGANPGLTENGLVIGACLGLTPSESREIDRRAFTEGDVDAAAESVLRFNTWSRSAS